MYSITKLGFRSFRISNDKLVLALCPSSSIINGLLSLITLAKEFIGEHNENEYYLLFDGMGKRVIKRKWLNFYKY